MAKHGRTINKRKKTKITEAVITGFPRHGF